ncbi:hypothetical protein IV203_017701 [Nitzschia inconspicua]|uniref:Uncharacterized protein n=1 Tax=Nitzschia inconspicua TaxID=303405 RepID=A0A9K3K8J3_9STRA|nr:hypothetical protein IV203_017701 [Nitzschia inconspicua]
MSNQTTTQDAIVAHQSASNGLDGNSFGTTSVQEEEIFVNCASFGGDAEDEADEVEENAYDVGSIDIMDGRAKMSVVSRDDTKHVDLEALKDQDGFCPGDMDALCVSKNNTIDGASKVPMGSDSSDLFVADEKKRDVKNSRFGWYLPKPKKRGAADVPPSLESDGSADGSSSINQCEAEMVICTDGDETKSGKAERAGFVSEEFQQMNAESLANITKEKDRGFFDGEESVAQEQLSVTTDDDIDQAIKNANLIDDEPIEQHDTRSQRSNGTARNKAFPTNMNGEMDSLASSHHSLKLSAKTGEDDIKFTSSIQFNKSSKIVGVGDCNLVSSQKSGVGKDMLSVCSQISREFLLKETSNDDESADSRHLRKSVDTQIVSLYSERSPKSILKEAASDSKSSAHESTHSPDQDVASVYSQRSQAASLREVAEVGIDDKSVASRLSRKSAGTNVVSLYSQRSRKSISKEAASDSKSSAHESKQSSDQDVASVYSQRSQAASLREVAEVGNDDKSVTSRLSRKSAGTNVVSLYSQRSGKSISKEAASDSKSSASESKQSSDQDVVSVFSQRSQAASLREVADVGNDDKSVASRLSRKSAGTSVVSLYSQRSRKSISKEAASDSKSSATESKLLRPRCCIYVFAPIPSGFLERSAQRVSVSCNAKFRQSP